MSYLNCPCSVIVHLNPSIIGELENVNASEGCSEQQSVTALVLQGQSLTSRHYLGELDDPLGV